MSIQISIRHMVASKTIRQMVKDLCHEVKNKHKRVQVIDVKIEDINGPYKAGIDKRCHLKVRGSDYLAIDIEDIDEDITHAIDRAFYHLKKSLKIFSYNRYKRFRDSDYYAAYLIEAHGDSDE